MNTWGIPDWKDEAAYPDPKSTSATRWAWEFLRRNSDYRKDWARYIERAAKAAGEDPALRDLVAAMRDATAEAWKAFRGKYSGPGKTTHAHWGDLVDTLEMSDCMYECSPPPLPDETHREHLARCGKLTRTPLVHALGQRWGLEQIEPPHLSKLPGLGRLCFKNSALRGPAELDFRLAAPGVSGFTRDAVLTTEERKEEAARAFEYLLRHFGHAHFQNVAFDLRLPLEAQLNFAGRALKAAAELGEERGDFKRLSARNIDARSFRNYLRALDAVEIESAKSRDIVKVILPSEADRDNAAGEYAPSKKVDKWIAAAEALRDGGYRALPLNVRAAKLPTKKTAKRKSNPAR
jgi:hypothetical protein